MTSVALTSTNHAEDQNSHLRVATLKHFVDEWYGSETEATESRAGLKERLREHVKVNVGQYAGLLGHACPAGVYEYVPTEVSSL